MNTTSPDSSAGACPLPDRSEDARVKNLLASARVIAVVGMSPKPDRPSHEVGLYLRDAGYEVLPAHPHAETIGGLAVFASLSAIPVGKRVDIVDLFIGGDRVEPFVEEAARIGARAVWFQPGAENAVAEARARALGLEVVSGRCAMADHARLLGGARGG